MTDSQETLDNLAAATALSADIVAAQNGDTAARERLASPRTLAMEFPGEKQRAMGHALKIVEDLAELGISAEREYVEKVMPANEHAGAIHQIDIIIEG